MFARFQRFLKTDDGAVTVDWVVLAAAVTGLGIGTVATVRTGTGSLASDINTSLSSASVAGILAAAEAAYEFLYYDEATQEEVIDAYANATDSVLMLITGNILRAFDSMLASSAPTDAAMALDAYYVMTEELTSRGVSLPDGAPDFATLQDTYNNATG